MVRNIDNKPVIFLGVPGGFVAQEVTVGRNDGKLVDVIKGIQPGAAYASANSFILKSDLGKTSTAHTH